MRKVVQQMVDGESAGEQVARYRYRRQMTQDELAEASGLSVSAVKSIERGVRTGRLSTLSRLARALGVTTSDLLAPAAGASVVSEPGPDALFEIRRSLTPPLDAATAFAEDQVLKAGEPPGDGTGASASAQTLAYAERLYEQDRYDDVLTAVPTLLDEARALQQTDPADELPLAQAYLYAAEILIQVRQLDLAQHAIDKAMQIANRTADELLAAWVVSRQCWALMRQQRTSEVEGLAVRTADLIEPQMSTSSTEVLSTWGWLMLRASSAAVRDARADDAEEYRRKAGSAAALIDPRRRPRRWMPPAVAGFCPATVEYKGVSNAVLLGQPAAALSLAEGIRPSGVPGANSRNGHRLDVAAAQLAEHQHTEAVHTLLDVRQEAPAWMRHHAYARDVVGRLVENRRRAFADQVGLLADHVGIAA
jgi:transcriptional regulator with XRE-family HTH domain